MNTVTQITDRAVALLSEVPGILAVVLGGSRARGVYSPSSDVDIGIYYDAQALDLAALDAAATALDYAHRTNLVAKPGEWGNWVNGGGWLETLGMHVDFILRDWARVEQTLRECQMGIVHSHYQTGHPHAYINAMYTGELAVCKVLWDRDGTVTRAQSDARRYPPMLKAELIRLFSFETGFSQQLAASCISRSDTYYIAAHLVRSVSALNQVLFALNEVYCLNEKRAVEIIDSFKIAPAGYKRKVEAIFAEVGVRDEAACEQMKQLIDEATALL